MSNLMSQRKNFSYFIIVLVLVGVIAIIYGLFGRSDKVDANIDMLSYMPHLTCQNGVVDQPTATFEHRTCSGKIIKSYENISKLRHGHDDFVLFCDANYRTNWIKGGVFNVIWNDSTSDLLVETIIISEEGQNEKN